MLNPMEVAFHVWSGNTTVSEMLCIHQIGKKQAGLDVKV
jgi:hypothetical protein